MLIFSAAVSLLAGYVNAEEGGVATAAVHGVRAPCTEWTNKLYRQQSTKSKMLSSKKIDLQKDFAADVYLSEALSQHTPPSPSHTLSVFIVVTGKGGGRVEPVRRLEGQQFTKLGRKYQHF
jgi:hypothetical protein